MLTLDTQLGFMDQSLWQSTKFSGSIVILFLSKVCHSELGQTDSCVAWARKDKEWLATENDHENPYVKLVTHVKGRLLKVPLHDYFLKDCNLGSLLLVLGLRSSFNR